MFQNNSYVGNDGNIIWMRSMDEWNQDYRCLMSRIQTFTYLLTFNLSMTCESNLVCMSINDFFVLRNIWMLSLFFSTAHMKIILMLLLTCFNQLFDFLFCVSVDQLQIGWFSFLFCHFNIVSDKCKFFNSQKFWEFKKLEHYKSNCKPERMLKVEM